MFHSHPHSVSSSRQDFSSSPPLNRTIHRSHADLPVSPVNATISVPTANYDGLTTEQRELMNYYRSRLQSFESERQDFISRIDELSGSAKERHRLKWDLNQRDCQIGDLQKALSDAHVFLYEERDRLLSIAAENDKLKLNETEDRKRIQHLMALTQPIAQEVTYFRDARPETIHRNYPANRQKLFDSQKNLSNENEYEGEIRKQNGGEQNDKKYSTENQRPASFINATAGAGPSESRRQAFGSRITGQKPPHIPAQQRVVRTIFMPNESIEVLKQMIEQLKQQSQQQKNLFDQRTRALEEDRNIREAEHKEAISRQQSTIEDFKRDIELLNKRNEQTTKDYLALRHESQGNERKLKEENARLSKIGEEIKGKYEFAQVESEKIRGEINNEHAHYVSLYQRQTSASEEDLAILKAQYAATQDLYETRIKYLESRLAKSKNKYESLEEKRNREFEGFQNDVKSLRNALRTLENTMGKLKSDKEEIKAASQSNSSQSQSQSHKNKPSRSQSHSHSHSQSRSSQSNSNSKPGLAKQFHQVEGDVHRLQDEIAKLVKKFQLQ